MIKCTIPEYRRGFAKAEFVPAWQPHPGSLFAAHRAHGSTVWTVSLAHTPGPAGSLIPASYPRTRASVLALIAHVEAHCPEEVAVWRGIDGHKAMERGLTPAQAFAGTTLRLAAYAYAAEVAL